MADHNNHLGQLEEYGSVVTHERATYVVQEIAEKYDPRVRPLFCFLFWEPSHFQMLKVPGYNGSYGPSRRYISHKSCRTNAT